MHGNTSHIRRPASSSLAILAGCTLALGASCSIDGGGDGTQLHALRSVEIADGGIHCVTLYAGQTIDVGEVCVSVDSDVDTSAWCGAGATGVLYISYSTHEGWTLDEVHAAVGDELGDLPTNPAGNPVPGQFPYADDAIPAGTTMYTFTVPLCELGLDGGDTSCDVTAYVAAHAVVRKHHHHGGHQEETAWGDGERFKPQGNWATYFTVPLECTHDDGGSTSDGVDTHDDGGSTGGGGHGSSSGDDDGKHDAGKHDLGPC
jgi:hypothetical protein